jgi:hypothetical protein
VMSIACPLSSSLTFVLIVFPDDLCTAHTDHANFRHKIEFIARFRCPR